MAALVMLVLLVPGLALAQDFRPAEEPPADFVARQYIDSRGCVFLRDEETRGWKARVSRDGAPICGYPPTLSARGMDGKPRLKALDPNAGRSRAELLEEALAETVLTNLRPGELATDPSPLEKLPDMGPEQSSSAPGDALKAALAAAPDMRRSMGEALQPNKRLCELLGYNGTANPSALGADPSQGYCDSLPASDLSRLTFTRPVGTALNGEPAAMATAAPSLVEAVPAAAEMSPEKAPATTPSAPPKPVAVMPEPKAEPLKPIAAKPAESSAPKPTAAKPAEKPVVKTAPKPAVIKPAAAKPVEKLAPKAADVSVKDKPKPQSAPKTPAVAVTAQPVAKTPAAKAPAAAAPAAIAVKPKQEPSTGGGVIPAGARYVQVGTYADAANADRTAQAVAAMGYAVLRGKDTAGGRAVQFIMAGPFNDRQSIVKALDGIRRAGFKDAYPR